VSWRPAQERLVLDGARKGLRTIVVRPGIVYGGSVAQPFSAAAARRHP
jgi:nucleoside-diphosphate-sugar epimerase